MSTEALIEELASDLAAAGLAERLVALGGEGMGELLDAIKSREPLDELEEAKRAYRFAYCGGCKKAVDNANRMSDEKRKDFYIWLDELWEEVRTGADSRPLPPSPIDLIIRRMTALPDELQWEMFRRITKTDFFESDGIRSKRPMNWLRDVLSIFDCPTYGNVSEDGDLENQVNRVIDIAGRFVSWYFSVLKVITDAGWEKPEEVEERILKKAEDAIAQINVVDTSASPGPRMDVDAGTVHSFNVDIGIGAIRVRVQFQVAALADFLRDFIFMFYCLGALPGSRPHLVSSGGWKTEAGKIKGRIAWDFFAQDPSITEDDFKKLSPQERIQYSFTTLAPQLRERYEKFEKWRELIDRIESQKWEMEKHVERVLSDEIVSIFTRIFSAAEAKDNAALGDLDAVLIKYLRGKRGGVN